MARTTQHQTIPAPSAPSFLENFYSPEQLVAELGITIRTLYRWHSKRCAPPRIQVQRMVLYNKESVKAWLLANEAKLPLVRGRAR